MQLVRPLATSVVRFVNAPKGSDHVFVPDFVRGVKERYRFWEAPESMEQFNLSTGAKFKAGLFERTKIDGLTVYNNGLSVEGHADTAELDAIAADVIDWASKEFNLDFLPNQPLSKGFSSALEVSGDPTMGRQLARLEPVLERLTLMVAGYGITLATYQTTGVIAQSEPSMGKPLAPGRFIFEHRTGTPLNSGIYYSEAPVSTSEHLELLDMIEAILAAG